MAPPKAMPKFRNWARISKFSPSWLDFALEVQFGPLVLHWSVLHSSLPCNCPPLAPQQLHLSGMARNPVFGPLCVNLEGVIVRSVVLPMVVPLLVLMNLAHILFVQGL